MMKHTARYKCSPHQLISAASTRRWIEDKRVAAAAFKEKRPSSHTHQNITFFCKGRYLEFAMKYIDNVSFSTSYSSKLILSFVTSMKHFKFFTFNHWVGWVVKHPQDK